MPLPNDIWCFLVGADSVFSVDIDETRTRTVDHLKEAIKAEMGYSAPAYNLTLYLVTVDGSYDKKTRMNELEGFFQNLKERKELDGWQELSGILGEGPPPGKIYFILVQPSKVSKRAASEPLEPDGPSKRLKADHDAEEDNQTEPAPSSAVLPGR